MAISGMPGRPQHMVTAPIPTPPPEKQSAARGKPARR
jgi:hypothetical protein